MYGLMDYGSMMCDSVRIEAHIDALRKAIVPGSVVLDLGAGAGIFSVIACQLGASKVYAIEPNNVIEVGRKIAIANGCAERIDFIQAMSTDVSLPEPVNVIIEDMRGKLPYFTQHIPSLVDARERFLALGGVIIPQKDTLWAAPVEAPELYRHHSLPWSTIDYGIDMEAGRSYAVNNISDGRVLPSQLLAQPKCWGTIDYYLIEDSDVFAKVEWTVERAANGHGMSCWFDATLIDNVLISNAPGAKVSEVYSNRFFPWAEPVALEEGDEIFVELNGKLAGSEYIWFWNTRIKQKGKSGKVKANFKQSQFLGEPAAPLELHKMAASYSPVLNEDALIDKLILERMQEKTNLRDIAECLQKAFPGQFSDWQVALGRVRKLSRKYTI